jgi:glycerol kinase
MNALDMSNLLLAIDQGTSSSRVMVFDLKGQSLYNSQYPMKSFFPKHEWVEQDAEQIWQTTLLALEDVLHHYSANDFIACGLTNQRETVVAWDKLTGDVLSPAIVWQDRRTQKTCDALLEDHQSWVSDKTGLRIDPYFSASKIEWLLKHNPQWRTLLEQQRLAIATIDAFLLWRLTGGEVYATDITNASRTMLMDINTGVWDADLLDFWQIPQSVLPEIRACDANFGNIMPDILGKEIPITGVMGDQQAALFGQYCFLPGMAKATFGTGAFLLMNTGDKPVQSKHGLISTVAYEVKNQRCYGLEGSIYHAGTTIKWLHDKLGLLDSLEQSEILARQVSSNGGVYCVSSFTGLGAPHWHNASGAKLVGLSLDTTPAHIARAALEGVAYQTRDVLACMQADMNKTLDVCRVDGGMAANHWFLQFLADQCRCQVEITNGIEVTAKGAALLAGVGAGAFSGIDAIAKKAKSSHQWSPSRAQSEVDGEYQGWLAALNL